MTRPRVPVRGSGTGSHGHWVSDTARGSGVPVDPFPDSLPALDRIRTHPSDSALLALAAGCTRQTADLIRHQSAPRDPVAGEWLRLADEAS